MSYVREVEFLEILDGVFRIARSQLKTSALEEA